MENKSGLKMRCSLQSAKTFSFTNPMKTVTYTAGEMVKINGSIGVVVEPVGNSDSTPGTQFPHGPNGVLVYGAERIILPKVAWKHDGDEAISNGGLSFKPGNIIYYNENFKAVTPIGRGNRPCGIALVPADDTDTEVECDLMVFPPIRIY